MIKIGETIHSYRKLKGLTQEELALKLGVSASAVSKWERDSAIPDIELLCALADFFETSVDNLLGRNQQELYRNYLSARDAENRLRTAEDLLYCCSIAGKEGLISMDEHLGKQKEERFDFPAFCAHFLLNGLQDNLTPKELEPFLERYAEAEKDPVTAKMTVTALCLICQGKNAIFLREVLLSFLGRQYHDSLPCSGDEEADARYAEEKEVDSMRREEKINYYCENRPLWADTHILDILNDCSDLKIQLLLRCTDSSTLECALLGVSEEIWRKFFRNLAERFFRPIMRNMLRSEYTEPEIRDAQKRILDDAVRLGVL